MTENDIYDNQRRYERIKEQLELLALKPEERDHLYRNAKYYCKNKKNLEYFRKLFVHFDMKDLSYVRRVRVCQTLMLICHATEQDLGVCTRDDINPIVAFMHSVYKTPKSKSDFIKDLKYLWRVLFPERDEHGRIDETITPYAVRHLTTVIDKSKEKLRNDRFTWEEFEKLLQYFSHDLRIQAYLFLALESLGRPQELLYLRLKDVELSDNYAKIYISEHGKEGTGFLQCIDSFPYVSRLYNQHPLKHDQNAFLFLNSGRKGRHRQLKPTNVNKMLRNACQRLGIHKAITAYSLKRNGVTFRRLRGDSDVEIQHAARWTSTKQLQIYDMSNQEDAFRMELQKRGIIPAIEAHLKPRVQTCMFCQTQNPLTHVTCETCHRPLDRNKIRMQEKQKEHAVAVLQNELESLKTHQQSAAVVQRFFEPEQIQALFKIVYKLQQEVQQMKQ